MRWPTNGERRSPSRGSFSLDNMNRGELKDPYSLGIWVRCEMCEDFWCTQHEEHAADCPCPPIEEWVGDAPFDGGDD